MGVGLGVELAVAVGVAVAFAVAVAVGFDVAVAVGIGEDVGVGVRLGGAAQYLPAVFRYSWRSPDPRGR